MTAESFRQPRQPLVSPGNVDLHVADMTATFAADVTLAEAQRKLGEINQWLPIDGDPELPLGKLVEENSTGPLRLGYGAWRDLLLGCQFHTKSGELITAGGRTVKNVAGYDLTKFMIGQRGYFGSIVTLTTRTYRRPTGAIVACWDSATSWLAGAIATPLRPRWGILTLESLWCGWLEDEEGLEFFEKRLASERPLEVSRRSVDDDIQHRNKLWNRRGDHWRISLPPMATRIFTQMTPLLNWSADPAHGIIIADVDSADTDGIFVATRAVGGSCVRHTPGHPPIWHPTDGENMLISSLKRAFDGQVSHS